MADPWKRVKNVKKFKAPSVFGIYGLPDRGKTYLACTFPKPLLLLDVMDLGVESVKEFEDSDQIDYLLIKDTVEFDDLFARSNKFDKYIGGTIVLDTCSNIQLMKRFEILLENEKQGKLTRNDYGTVTNFVNSIFLRLRDICIKKGINFVINFQEFEKKIDEDDIEKDGEDQLIFPAISAGVFTTVGPLCNYIVQVHYEIEEVEKNGELVERTRYYANIGPNDTYFTKFKTSGDKNKIPKRIKSPTYKKLMKYTTGLVKRKTPNGKRKRRK